METRLVSIQKFTKGARQFSIQKRAIFYKFKEIKGFCGDVP
jgi:hypothetical protein